VFFFSSRRRHTRCLSDWSSDVCSSDLMPFSGIIIATAQTKTVGPLLVDMQVKWNAGFAQCGRELKAIFHWHAGVFIRMPDKARRSEERRVGKECRTQWSEAE